MRVTDTQLDEYIALYKKEYGVDLERTKALIGLHKLLSLVCIMAGIDMDTFRNVEKEA